MLPIRWATPAFKNASKTVSWRPRSCPSTYSVCRRTIATETAIKRKPWYITTPIFYVNAAPHVGHLYTLVLTDILKRWRKVLGESDAQMLTGTDEHGIKIQKAAEKAGINTKIFCDENCEEFKKLVEVANIDHNYFIRTTDEDHKRAVEHAWRELNHRGYIYESKHEGWYSIGDETFVPESQVHLILDPKTGRKLMASMETGREVEWSSEVNYHFRLSEFKDKLLDFYKQNPDFVTPPSRMQEVISWVESGMEDLSISRPADRLSWGIPVPDDPSQTIYVWVDALMNYATRAGYPFVPGQESSRGWPPDVQVIGKDILRFHCVYWPAILMALDLPPPKRILSHAHWTMKKKKMSKSEGNVVNPFFAIDRFGTDTIRYYLAHEGGIVDDSSYDNSYIVRTYKHNLQNALGNLTSRVLRAKRWSVRSAVTSARDNTLPPPTKFDIDHLDRLNTIATTVSQRMESLDSRRALHEITDLINRSNEYMQKTAPWEMTRPDTDTIIYQLSESLRISGILLQPYIPTKAAQLLEMLGVSEEKRTIGFAVVGADYEYGEVSVGKKKKTGEGMLFPPIFEG